MISVCLFFNKALAISLAFGSRAELVKSDLQVNFPGGCVPLQLSQGDQFSTNLLFSQSTDFPPYLKVDDTEFALLGDTTRGRVHLVFQSDPDSPLLSEDCLILVFESVMSEQGLSVATGNYRFGKARNSIICSPDGGRFEMTYPRKNKLNYVSSMFGGQALSAPFPDSLDDLPSDVPIESEPLQSAHFVLIQTQKAPFSGHMSLSPVEKSTCKDKYISVVQSYSPVLYQPSQDHGRSRRKRKPDHAHKDTSVRAKVFKQDSSPDGSEDENDEDGVVSDSDEAATLKLSDDEETDSGVQEVTAMEAISTQGEKGKRRKGAGGPKRPKNAFMCWSVERRKQLQEQDPDMHMAEMSRKLGREWRALTDEEKKPYEKQAEELKAKLLREHPDYKYRPRKRQAHSKPEASKKNVFGLNIATDRAGLLQQLEQMQHQLDYLKQGVLQLLPE
ncbi:SOX family transcription factor [Spongorhabdus nitratireducens]